MPCEYRADPLSDGRVAGAASNPTIGLGGDLGLLDGDPLVLGMGLRDATGHDRLRPRRPGRLPLLGQRQGAGMHGTDASLAGQRLRLASAVRRARSPLARDAPVGQCPVGLEADGVAPDGRNGPPPDGFAREGDRRFIRIGGQDPVGVAGAGGLAIVALGHGGGIGDGPAAIIETRRPIRGRISVHRPTLLGALVRSRAIPADDPSSDRPRRAADNSAHILGQAQDMRRPSAKGM
jgi:hypothetical protein